MEFAYVGRTPSGTLVRGRRDAADERELELILEQENIEVERISKPLSAALSFGAPRVKQKDMLVLTRQFASLLKGSMNTAEALTVLRKQTRHPTLKAVITAIETDVKSGMPLSAALRKHPKYFTNIYINCVVAGEKSGDVGSMLGQLAGALERSYMVRGKVKVALTYPSILAVVLTAVFIAMLYFIIPQFAKIYEKAGYSLPPLTLALLGIAGFVRRAGPFLLIIPIALSFIVPQLLKNDDLRTRVDRAVLKIPVLGTFVLSGSMATLCRIMSMTLASDEVAVNALLLSAETVPNRFIQKELLRAAQEVKTGVPIGVAFEHLGDDTVPPMVVAFTEVGLKVGQLHEQLAVVAEHYEKEVEHDVDQVLKYIEPIFLVIGFAMVSLLVIGVYQPMFKAITLTAGAGK